MAHSIDLNLLAQRMKRARSDRKTTLREVGEKTGVSVATLSRIERNEAKAIEGGTLIALTSWLGTPAEDLIDRGDSDGSRMSSPSTPDAVELHLRADKRLDKKTADALANMFRIAYETLSKDRSEERT